MVDKEKILRCIERWGAVSLLTAIKEEGLDDEESGLMLELVMEKVRRDAERENPPPVRPALMELVRKIDERQARMEDRALTVDSSLDALRTQMSALHDALNILAGGMAELINGPNSHSRKSGNPENSGPRIAVRGDEDETKVVNLANRRQPSRTPPETRKGA